MGTHVIVGAGAIGTATALLLARSGEQVRVVSRRGSGPDETGVELCRADASDVGSLAAATRDASVIYNCANPRYSRWEADWPPIARALLAAAEGATARLVTVSNLYSYTPPVRPIVETDPLDHSMRKGQIRAEMWTEALAAHEAGRLEVTEARASDYYGPGLTNQGHLGERVVPRVIAGRSVSLVGDSDTLHSWTYVPDVARTLVAIGSSPVAVGRAWHVPTLAPRSARAMVEAFTAGAASRRTRVHKLPRAAIRLAGLFSADLREMPQILYQFERPFVMDSSAAQRELGLAPTPFDETIEETLAWWREKLGQQSANSHELRPGRAVRSAV
jgi:nucleoside-diphosphate-sugar epimerase